MLPHSLTLSLTLFCKNGHRSSTKMERIEVPLPHLHHSAGYHHHVSSTALITTTTHFLSLYLCHSFMKMGISEVTPPHLHHSIDCRHQSSTIAPITATTAVLASNSYLQGVYVELRSNQANPNRCFLSFHLPMLSYYCLKLRFNCICQIGFKSILSSI